jgi:hypothetical protein
VYAIYFCCGELIHQLTVHSHIPITNCRIASSPPRRTPIWVGGNTISWTCSYCMTKIKEHTHLSYPVIA